eukprot:2326444-Prymnesium_polylepis.1
MIVQVRRVREDLHRVPLVVITSPCAQLHMAVLAVLEGEQDQHTSTRRRAFPTDRRRASRGAFSCVPVMVA